MQQINKTEISTAMQAAKAVLTADEREKVVERLGPLRKTHIHVNDPARQITYEILIGRHGMEDNGVILSGLPINPHLKIAEDPYSNIELSMYQCYYEYGLSLKRIALLVYPEGEFRDTP